MTYDDYFFQAMKKLVLPSLNPKPASGLVVLPAGHSLSGGSKGPSWGDSAKAAVKSATSGGASPASFDRLDPCKCGSLEGCAKRLVGDEVFEVCRECGRQKEE